jgi:hypothetical protein
LLSDRLDENAGGFADDAEDAEEEFEAHFDPLNEVDLKVRTRYGGAFSIEKVRADCAIARP